MTLEAETEVIRLGKTNRLCNLIGLSLGFYKQLFCPIHPQARQILHKAVSHLFLEGGAEVGRTYPDHLTDFFQSKPGFCEMLGDEALGLTDELDM